MASAYPLAEKHIDQAIAEAAKYNIDSNTMGQALIVKLIAHYKSTGRSSQDIVDEIQFTLDNIDEDGFFHVVRN